jgi:hypothetical protein
MLNLMEHEVSGTIYGVNLGEVPHRQTVSVLKISICNHVSEVITVLRENHTQRVIVLCG